MCACVYVCEYVCEYVCVSTCSILADSNSTNLSIVCSYTVTKPIVISAVLVITCTGLAFFQC